MSVFIEVVINNNLSYRKEKIVFLQNILNALPAEYSEIYSCGIF
jgi:hypothetical protein